MKPRTDGHPSLEINPNSVEEINRRWLRVRDIASITSMSERFIYAAIESGDLPAVRWKRAVRIPRDAFEQWLVDKEAEAKEKSNDYGSKARTS